MQTMLEHVGNIKHDWKLDMNSLINKSSLNLLIIKTLV